MVELKNIRVVYNKNLTNEKQALDGLDLTIKKRRIRYNNRSQWSWENHIVKNFNRRSLSEEGGLYIKQQTNWAY